MNQYPAKPMMDQMAQHGRYGDSMLVHMNPVEVAGIASLSPTGSLTTNPVTGQPEAFLPLLFGALGGALKLGALGTGVLTGVGTAAVTGDLKRGLISGLTAGLAAPLGEGIGSLFDSAPEVLDTANAATAGAEAAASAADAGTAALDLSNATSAMDITDAAYQLPIGDLSNVDPSLLDPGNALGQINQQLAGTGQTLSQAGVTTGDTLAAQLQQSRDLVASTGPTGPTDFASQLQETKDLVASTAPVARTPNMSDAVFGRGEGIAQAGLKKLGGMGQFVAASTGQSMLEQMDVQEDFERAERGRMAESEEKKAQSVADLQRGFSMAQPNAPRGRSPMRARMDSYIRDYGTDLYAAGGGQMPRMQEGGQADNSYQEWQNSGSDLSYADWLAQGGSSKSDEPVVTSADLGQLVVDPTGDEAAVLAMAKGNQALTPAQQQVLEGYYNRYEQERQNRASQITETDSDFDLGAVARDLPSMFGYASSMNLGGIDPVTIQAGLRGEYAVRPPDDYMPGFEAEYSYFQDDPYAQKNPYRGYRPTTGGIESEGPYFDPILDRQSYKNKLKEYYKTLASYGMGTGPDDPDDPDDPDEPELLFLPDECPVECLLKLLAETPTPV